MRLNETKTWKTTRTDPSSGSWDETVPTSTTNAQRIQRIVDIFILRILSSDLKLSTAKLLQVVSGGNRNWTIMTQAQCFGKLVTRSRTKRRK